MTRVLAFIEAHGVTGPVRNLLETAGSVDLHLATYRRRGAPRESRDGVDALLSAVAARGIPVTVIDERGAFDPAALSAVSRTITTLQPDVVQTHNIKSHALVAAAPARRGIPWVAFHHGYTSTDLKVRLYNRLDRWTLPRADAVVTTCARFAEDLEHAGVGADRISVVHNAVVPARPVEKASARRRLDLDRGAAIVAVGRLSWEKGHDILLDACAMIRREFNVRDVQLVIAGDGPERRRLAARARNSRVSLRLDGYQSDIAPYYAAADVFVLPSRSEGSPNALLEAMAAGCPIIATRVVLCRASLIRLMLSR